MKSPEERGHPAAAWIVEARERLELSDRQVIALLGKWTTSTLRKAEADSRNLSRPMWRALVDLYRRLADEKGLTLRPAPKFREPSSPQQSGSSDSVLDAIAGQTQWLQRQWEATTALVAGVTELVGEMRAAREGSLERDAALVKAILAGIQLAPAERGHGEQPASAVPQRHQ